MFKKTAETSRLGSNYKGLFDILWQALMMISQDVKNRNPDGSSGRQLIKDFVIF